MAIRSEPFVRGGGVVNTQTKILMVVVPFKYCLNNPQHIGE